MVCTSECKPGAHNWGLCRQQNTWSHCSYNFITHQINFTVFSTCVCVFVCVCCVCMHTGSVSCSWALTAGWQNCQTRPSCTPSKPNVLRWSRRRRQRFWPSVRWSVKSSRRSWRYQSNRVLCFPSLWTSAVTGPGAWLTLTVLFPQTQNKYPKWCYFLSVTSQEVAKYRTWCVQLLLQPIRYGG